MTAPHINVSQEDADTLVIRMDRAGYDIFRRLLGRSAARPDDNQQTFNRWKDRVIGALMAGAVVMGWEGK